MSSSPRSASARILRNQPLASVLTAARYRAGMSQRQLAKHLHRAHSFVAKTELGDRDLKAAELWEYANALCADPAELLRQAAVPAGATLSADELNPIDAAARK